MSRVLFGIDQVLAKPGLLSGRLGLVTNDAARTALDPRGKSRLALQRAGFELVRLFSPEHGLGANAADGAAVSDGSDGLTGLPVVSLYGEKIRPPREALADLDAVIFDIPDIGARFYTYIWTLWHVLEACAEFGVRFIVLDRPNPLGGDLAMAEGPILDVARFGSFVGRAAIPIRHSLTVGELAQLWNAEGRWLFQDSVAADVSPLHSSESKSGLTSAATALKEERSICANLQVVPCSGWTRAMHWPDTGLQFVQTSPAIASYESALLYPGLCLFEATNLSVGRGTDLAFQVIGAPWLRAAEIVRDFNALQFAGVGTEATTFTPWLPPHAGMACEAVRLRLREPSFIRPVSVGLHLLATVIRRNREHFQWTKYPTAANPGGADHFERLLGRTAIRAVLEAAPRDLAARIRTWTAAAGWTERANACRLYSQP